MVSSLVYFVLYQSLLRVALVLVVTSLASPIVVGVVVVEEVSTSPGGLQELTQLRPQATSSPLRVVGRTCSHLECMTVTSDGRLLVILALLLS